MPLSLQRFRPRLVDALAGYNRQRALADISAGATVGIVARRSGPVTAST